MDNESFNKGREALNTQDYMAAAQKFKQVFDSIDEQHESYNRVASYLGLSRVLTSDPDGLLLCRDAASCESRDGEVFLNLACAEWHAQKSGHERTREVSSISISSLTISCSTPRAHRI